MKTRRFPTNMGANLDVLCWRLNELTNPAELRSDEESEWCQSEAKAIRATIRRRWGTDYYEEGDSGRWIPTRFYFDERDAYFASLQGGER